MTGFGSALVEASGARGRALHIEARAVNGRYLEVRSRHPFGGETTELIARQVKARVGRGRVEITIAWGDDGAAASRAGGPSPARLEEAARALVRAQSAAAGAGLSVAPPTAEAVWAVAEGMEANARRTAREDVSTDAAPPGLEDGLARALDGLESMRVQEGEALERALRGHLDELEAKRAAIEAGLDASREAVTASVHERAQRWMAALSDGTLDPARLHAEVAVVLARGDVCEELDRLASHVVQARQCLGGPATRGQGKKLDFIAQELGREWTTTGAKLASAALCAVAVDAREILDRFKEQVQNVE